MDADGRDNAPGSRQDQRSGRSGPRVPPSAVDAERAVLGGLMLSPEKIDAVAAQLAIADFYRKDHATIFQAMLDMAAAGTPCDAVTMGDWFESNGLSGLVKTDQLYDLANSTPGSANIQAYVQIVRQKSMARSVIDIGSQIAESGWSGADTAESIDDAIRRLMDLHRMDQSSEWTMRQAAKKAYDHLAAVAADPNVGRGVPSGLTKLDECLGGFHKGELTIVAARPAMGKTAWLMGSAQYAAGQGYPVGVVSGEMSVEQLGLRSLALESNIAASRFRTANLEESDWPRITSGAMKLRDMPMWILDRPSPYIDEICRTARRWKQQHNIAALYLDYLQRFQAGPGKKWEVVSEVVFRLSCLARELDIPVIALAQVKREVESRSDKRPHMGDICDSGEIEKEASQVITIYRDDYYNENSEDKGTAEFIVDKNRHGPNGFVRVAFVKETMRFADLDCFSDY